MTRNPCWLIPDFHFFFSEDFYKKNRNIQKSFKEFSENFKKKKMTGEKRRRRRNKLWMDTVEHTASTILVGQMVTKNSKKGSFYSVLELWLFTNHMDLCGCSFYFHFSFPHKTGGVCKCASAIWTLSGVLFFYSWGRVAGVTRPRTRAPNRTFSCVVVDPETWSTNGAEAGKSRMGSVVVFVVVVENGVQSCINPWGNWGRHEFPSTLASAHTLPTHRLTYALLFIQAVRYHSGDGSTNYNGRIATTLTKSPMTIPPPPPPTEIRDSGEGGGARLLPPPVCI